MSGQLTYTPMCGQSIHDAAQEMVALVLAEGKRVTAIFNQAPTLADPGMIPDDVVALWRKTSKRVWARQSKLTRSSSKRRQRKATARHQKQAWAFVEASQSRAWGADPVADLLFIEPWLGCLGWTYTTGIVSDVRRAINVAYQKLDFKDCGVDTPELYARWLLANAADMQFDGPTVSFFERFHTTFDEVPA